MDLLLKMRQPLNSKELQLRQEVRRQKEAEHRHKEVIARTAVWKEKILPKWIENRNSKKVRDLCYDGIPPSLRGRVWCLLIGNFRKVSEEYFKQLCVVADSLYEEAASR